MLLYDKECGGDFFSWEIDVFNYMIIFCMVGN